jgi:hypothetical protein
VPMLMVNRNYHYAHDDKIDFVRHMKIVTF